MAFIVLDIVVVWVNRVLSDWSVGVTTHKASNGIVGNIAIQIFYDFFLDSHNNRNGADSKLSR